MIASSCLDWEPFWKFHICILSSEIGTFSNHQTWAFQLPKRLNLVFRACLRRWEGLQALESITDPFWKFQISFWRHFLRTFSEDPKRRDSCISASDLLKSRFWTVERSWRDFYWTILFFKLLLLNKASAPNVERFRASESDCKLLLGLGAILKISNLHFELWNRNFFKTPDLSFSAPETLKSSF